MYNDQIFDFIINNETHNISNRGYINRQSRGNFVLNYIIRFGLKLISNALENSRLDISKYIIIIPKAFQLQKIYYDIIEKHSQSRSQYISSQSYIPRVFDNIHNDDNEKIYFVEHEHNCNMIDCPHRNNN